VISISDFLNGTSAVAISATTSFREKLETCAALAVTMSDQSFLVIESVNLGNPLGQKATQAAALAEVVVNFAAKVK
jgi:hypothetical protein